MSKATVFIGDLSRFCSDEDISSLFHRFGKVLETKIMRNPVTGISLGYGFLIMSSTESAFLAMQYLHGVQLRGRPLRVKWAGRNIKSDASSASAPRFPRDSPAETVINSVHVRFQALHISSCLFTEESLYQFFLPFGEVTDASIKESNVDEATGLQHGYGFVHFNSTADGAQSAFRAIMELTGDAFFSLHCEGSRNFMKQFHGNQVTQPSPAASRPNSANAPTSSRPSHQKFRSIHSAPSSVKSINPPYRDFNFPAGPPYYNQSPTSQAGPEVLQPYPSASYHSPPNILPNPVYCYAATGPYGPVPSSDTNVILAPSAFPAQSNVPTYSSYDSYPPNYTYFPVPAHIALHPHLASNTAGPTTKPSYLSYNTGPSSRMQCSIPQGMGASRPPDSKEENPSFISHRADDKVQFDKRAHARNRGNTKARSANAPRHVAQGIGESNLLAESHHDMTGNTIASKSALV